MWISITCFDSFGVKHIPKWIKKNHQKQKYHNKHLCDTTIQFENVWILCIRFIDFMLKDKNLLDYSNLFSPNEYEKNDKIILKYFQ